MKLPKFKQARQQIKKDPYNLIDCSKYGVESYLYQQPLQQQQPTKKLMTYHDTS